MHGVTINEGLDSHFGFDGFRGKVKLEVADVINEFRHFCLCADWKQRTEQHAKNEAKIQSIEMLVHWKMNYQMAYSHSSMASWKMSSISPSISLEGSALVTMLPT